MNASRAGGPKSETAVLAEDRAVDREPVELVAGLEVGAERHPLAGVQVQLEVRLDARRAGRVVGVDNELEAARGTGKGLVPEGGNECLLRVVRHTPAMHGSDLRSGRKSPSAYEPPA